MLPTLLLLILLGHVLLTLLLPILLGHVRF